MLLVDTRPDIRPFPAIEERCDHKERGKATKTATEMTFREAAISCLFPRNRHHDEESSSLLQRYNSFLTAVGTSKRRYRRPPSTVSIQTIDGCAIKCALSTHDQPKERGGAEAALTETQHASRRADNAAKGDRLGCSCRPLLPSLPPELAPAQSLGQASYVVKKTGRRRSARPAIEPAATTARSR